MSQPQNKCFSDIGHVYSLGRRRIPSVSQTLGCTGISFDWSRIDPLVLARKRALGTALHKALHYLHDRDLDRESLAPELKPYLAAHELFLKDTGFVSEQSELRRWPTLNQMDYGMQLDTTGIMLHKPYLIDWKISEGAPSYAWAIQTAAYAQGIPAPLIPPFRWLRASLQLMSNGRYKFARWEDPGDIEEFKAALFLTWRKVNRGENIWK